MELRPFSAATSLAVSNYQGAEINSGSGPDSISAREWMLLFIHRMILPQLGGKKEECPLGTYYLDLRIHLTHSPQPLSPSS